MPLTRRSRAALAAQNKSQCTPLPQKRALATKYKRTRSRVFSKSRWRQEWMSWIKTRSHNKPIASNQKANTYRQQTQCHSPFILVVILNLPLLVNSRQTNLRQTSSSESLMSCWSVSDLTPFNTLSSPSNSLQSRKRKLLMPRDADATLCLALSKAKWKLWEKTLLSRQKWVKNSKFAVKWWLYGHVREKLLEESEPFKWNAFTR